VSSESSAAGSHAQLIRRSPDKLDRLLRVNTSLAGAAFAMLLLVMAAAIVWSFASTAPIKILAQGILLSKLGVADVTANAAGRVKSLKVAVGDRVVAGQAVAELSQPDLGDTLLSKRLELDARNAEREQVRELAARTLEVADRQRGLRMEALEVRLVSLATRLATLREIEFNTAALLTSGITTRFRALEATNERSRTENERNDARSQVLTLRAEAEEERARDEREILKADQAVAAAERALAVSSASLSRSDVVQAQLSGTIVEVNVNLGERIEVGVPLMRMLPADETGSDLQAVIFVPGGGGKRVKPGMEAQIIPATVRLQRDGFIQGRVVSVSDLPATRESMMRVLKNAGFVDQLTKSGLPYEAKVLLDADPTSPTRLRWSTGVGPADPIGVGTVAEAKIVVDRVPIIGLVIPRAETVVAFLRRASASVMSKL
jgi:HlyD family secretion protein